MIKGSVGIVTTQYYHHPSPLVLESGETLPSLTLAYETYGKLNREQSNAILVCHALSGDAHVAGFHEGEKRAGLVGCSHRSGQGTRYRPVFRDLLEHHRRMQRFNRPVIRSTRQPGNPTGPHFPVITIRDMVNAQKLLIDHLGISQLYAVAGGSMGGMQVLQWTVSYPDLMKKAVVIAATGYSTPQQIAFNEVGQEGDHLRSPTGTTATTTGRHAPTAARACARPDGRAYHLPLERVDAREVRQGTAGKGPDRV